MKIMQDLMEQLSGPAIVDAVVELMLVQIDGFQEAHSCYLAAINRLKKEVGNSVDRVATAVYKRAASDLLFAAFLGLKMNWDHFQNPMTPNCTWPQVDFCDYLQEDLAHSLPDYRAADDSMADFRSKLTAKQRETYSAITEYDTYLQTVGPKLAHYYGYLLGNSLLQRLIPGYREDAVLTMKYNAMLDAYFGKHFLPIEPMQPVVAECARRNMKSPPA